MPESEKGSEIVRGGSRREKEESKYKYSDLIVFVENPRLKQRINYAKARIALYTVLYAALLAVISVSQRCQFPTQIKYNLNKLAMTN